MFEPQERGSNTAAAIIKRITLPRNINPAVFLCLFVGSGSPGSSGVSIDDI